AVPVVVARAERLPFAAGSFDGVCGAQMWHWVDVAAASAEVARVLRPGGWLALWWNEVDADGLPWWDEQQDRLEAGNPRYRRGYRARDYRAELLETGVFAAVDRSEVRWSRTLDLALYERWLRSKSYVQALGDVEGFLAAERASVAAAFPSGLVTEPFVVTLWLARLR
ncbi:MAG: class I SAM-dependent methyltransferase, partial [Actinomycetota bacterium]|nr:class I SAM-dependent methyltransferase [Actinomycetota bacterium]